MARFDFYTVPEGYLLDIQSNLTRGLGTRVVVPLVEAPRSPNPTRKLHPAFEIDGRRFVMATHLMTAVSEQELRRKAGSLDEHYDRIISAIDMVFNGF